ncbi:hypothetical protein [Schaalia hyovaginalis]|uniref:hypothetical protein n=1 Tax=Schaalia hyovaginalis TaxID=29316 RepID=UPI0026ED5A1A|nr:hypothetical protein [Schaalia hyovaginalis]MCI6557330.1 hypothetical protein [Schaalia hyovaginalis]MDY3094205.1 hypothetical protein [Schaalia hyovaginalis]MDY3664718.1 hypothetical protein [Schaalia hyovaginalis]
MSGAFTQGAAELIALLATQGIRGTTDPRDLDPPCALIVPTEMRPSDLGGSVWISWEIYLLAPDSGDTLASLDALAVKARAALGRAVLTATSLTVANLNPDPLPALLLTIETEH